MNKIPVFLIMLILCGNSLAASKTDKKRKRVIIKDGWRKAQERKRKKELEARAKEKAKEEQKKAKEAERIKKIKKERMDEWLVLSEMRLLLEQAIEEEKTGIEPVVRAELCRFLTLADTLKELYRSETNGTTQGARTLNYLAFKDKFVGREITGALAIVDSRYDSKEPKKSFVKLLFTYAGRYLLTKKEIKVKLIAPNDVEYMKKLIVRKKGTKIYFYGTIDDIILERNRVCTVTVNLGQPNEE